VDVFSMMKCEGWGMSIDIQVGCDRCLGPSGGGGGGGSAGGGDALGGGGSRSGVGRLSTGGSASGSPSRQGSLLAPGSRHFQPGSLPHVYIGEFQVTAALH
jgi:hypothetical protein